MADHEEIYHQYDDCNGKLETRSVTGVFEVQEN